MFGDKKTVWISVDTQETNYITPIGNGRYAITEKDGEPWAEAQIKGDDLIVNTIPDSGEPVEVFTVKIKDGVLHFDDDDMWYLEGTTPPTRPAKPGGGPPGLNQNDAISAIQAPEGAADEAAELNSSPVEDQESMLNHSAVHSAYNSIIRADDLENNDNSVHKIVRKKKRKKRQDEEIEAKAAEVDPNGAKAAEVDPDSVRNQELRAAQKKRRRVLRDSIQGISRPAIKRMARRGGVKRLSSAVHEEMRNLIKAFTESIVRDSVLYAEYSNRKTIVPLDVVYALKRQGRAFYGFTD